ncbi:molybdopterin-dependent oxidoreductase [Halorubrum sp. F4]|uniref:molybdopterin-dependent oxidoreductase n=1 Tax=Halorubrum sp. F4 TaxID=2989715 RepID=UPI002480BB68|nr:molybdopterin-dependent oxidoreductase [Halorubrum sp. F4]
MSSLPTPRDAAVSLVAGVLAVAASFAVAGAAPSFVVSPIDRVIVDATPGTVIAVTIETVGEAGHLLHLSAAVAVAVGLFGLVALVGLRVGDSTDSPVTAGLLAGGIAWLLAVGLTAEPLPAAGPALVTGVVTAAGTLGTDPGAIDPARRRTIAAALGVAGASGAAVLAGGRRDDDPLHVAPNAEGAETRLRELESAALDVESDDLVGLVSPIEEFYNVDIAEFDPEVAAGEWSLTFTGETGADVTVDYGDLTDRPTEQRAVSLRCVGESLNGRKLDTAVWTGTPIRPLLESVDPEGDCDCAMLRGEDGYYVQFPVDVLADGFLAWGMNGRTLPPQHGHPVRVLIPGHWGETNVKWLTEIELLETAEDGYWEERGWQGTGSVNAVAKLWDEGITELDDGRVELAGHAYAGIRGIERVEVSIDGGVTWTDAALSDPLPDADVWRQWRHVFVPDGDHEIVVRTVDGEGTRQSGEESDRMPSGATGWVRRTISG